MADGLDELIENDLTASGSGQSEGGKLRKQLEDALGELKALREENAANRARQREQAVDSLFSKHSVPALAKDFFPKDAEPTDEVVTSFVEKYGQLWGAQAATATTPPDQQAATNAAQTFAQQAAPPVVGPLSEDDYRAKFAEAKNPAELARLIDELSAAGAVPVGAV